VQKNREPINREPRTVVEINREPINREPRTVVEINREPKFGTTLA
jgi:hypothetical protein